MKGRDVCAIFPTGFGKSLCYACLPFAVDSCLLRRKNCCCDHSTYTRNGRSGINTLFDRNIIIILSTCIMIIIIINAAMTINSYIPSPLLCVPRPSASYCKGLGCQTSSSIHLCKCDSMKIVLYIY